jgi:serine/threonine protein kinase
MSRTTACSRCGYGLSSDREKVALAGICPRCLAQDILGESRVGPASHQGPDPSGALDDPESPLHCGTEFQGFEILDVLGRGGMGIVYRARQSSLGRMVALKLLSPKLARSEEFVVRFEREAKRLASLNHPNVVRVYGSGRERDSLFLAMEYVEGSTLQERFDEDRPLQISGFLSLLAGVCDGLERIHRAGLIHRDIKPANILLPREGGPRISDFGLAVETKQSEKLTETGAVLGTPHYMSPEQILGQPMDGRSDLYALGVILFQGLARRLPFEGASPTAVLVKHVEEEPPSLRSLVPGISPELEELTASLLDKDPAARPASALALKECLTTLAGKGRGGQLASTSGKGRQGSLRVRPTAVAAGAVVLGLLISLAALMATRSPAPLPEAPAKTPLESVDLLKLIDPKVHALQGTWSRSGPILVSNSPNRRSTVLIPYSPPDEYDLLLVVRRIHERVDGFDIGLSSGSSRFFLTLDGWGQPYDLAGLSAIDGKDAATNPTRRDGRVLTLGKDSSIVCQVRKTGVGLSVDGRMLVDWKGPRERLSLPVNYCNLPLEGKVYLSSNAGAYQVSRITLIPVSGRGRLQEAEELNLAAPVETLPNAPTAAAPRGWQPLFDGKTLDFIRAHPRNAWQVENQALMRRPGSEESCAQTALEFGDGQIRIRFLVERLYYMTFVVRQGEEGGYVVLYDKTQLPPLNTINELIFTCQGSSVTATQNGFPIKVRSNRGPRQGCLQICAGNNNVVGLRILAVDYRPISAESLQNKDPSTAPVDLLKLIDPAKDSVVDRWTLDGSTLVTPAKRRFSLLQIPYRPPDEYDLVAEVERKETPQSGIGSCSFDFGLAVGERQFGVYLGARDPKTGDATASSLNMVDGGSGDAGARYGGIIFENGAVAKIRISIRTSGLKVIVDGKTIIEWSDYKRLSNHGYYRVPDSRCLFLGAWIRYDVTKLELIPISGSGGPLRSE